MKSIAYISGFVFGVIFVIISYLLFGKKKKGIQIYDERQKLVQKTGFKWGFCTSIILIMLKAILAEFGCIKFMSEIISAVIIVLVSLSVYLVYCIFHDAYLSLTDKPKQIIIFLTLSGILNIFLSFAVNYRERRINLLIGIFVIFIALNVAIRQLMLKKQS